MLLVRVDNGKNTLLMELPCKRMLMAEHLASVAITAPASEVKCASEENAPIKVKILGVSDFAGKLASLISPEDSLSLVNTACEMYQTLPYQNKLEAQAAVLNDQVDTVRDFLRYMMEHRMEDTIAKYYCPLVATLYNYDRYGNLEAYEKCFEGHLALAEQGYPLAECQVGYFYYDGLGVEKDLEKAVWWTRRAADHGDRDGQCNLAWFYEDGIGVEQDLEQAAFWYRQAALQDHDLAIKKCSELGISLGAGIVDKEAMRKVLKCRIFPLNSLPSYKYTVICSNYKGKWILSRHKKRDTWETQGGHIEDGETPLEAAKRELFEESGIRDADVYPVCDYWGFNPFRCSNGMVFLAVVHSIGELPESEMQEIGMFDELPENLTYPQTSPVLYREAEKMLRRMLDA